MLTREICVVSDKLKAFADNERVLIVSQFLELLAEESQHAHGTYYNVHIGQGISDAGLDNIFSTIKNNRLTARFNFLGITQDTRRASLKATHKHEVKNIMISQPERLSDSVFESYLMLDENCAEMSDHVTGQHIQGMVMVEAARQMINALTEDHLLTPEQAKDTSYVLNNVDSKFYQYIFPLEVKLRCEIVKIRRVANNNFTASTKISVMQGDEVMMEVGLGYSVISKSYIEQKEKNMAMNAVMRILEIGRAHLSRGQGLRAA